MGIIPVRRFCIIVPFLLLVGRLSRFEMEIRSKSLVLVRFDFVVKLEIYLFEKCCNSTTVSGKRTCEKWINSDDGRFWL